VVEDADDESSPVSNSVSSRPKAYSAVSMIQIPPISGSSSSESKEKKMIAGSTAVVLIVIAIVLCVVFGRTPIAATAVAEVDKYDGSIGAPKCSRVSSSCDSGSLLLAGKGPDEANFPGNTINGCWDGIGTYHEDSSIDSIIVRSVDMTDFKPGSTVEIEAKIWAVAERDATFIHFFFNADAANPSWEFIATIDKISEGESIADRSTSYPVVVFRLCVWYAEASILQILAPKEVAMMPMT
jgi:hypothetical protein